MADWFVAQTPVWGIPFQNWMMIAAAVVLVSLLFAWLTYR